MIFLIAGLMDLVYQSDAFAAIAGVLVTGGKGNLFQWNKRRKAKFGGEQGQYWGTGNLKN